MSAVPLWFERKFDFSFPATLFPNLCVRLRGTPARLEDLLRNAPRDVLVEKPGEKWSAQEHAGHLLDLEPLWTARVDDFIAGRPQLTVADLANRKTQDANHNARRVDQIVEEFRAARTRLLARAAEANPASDRAIPHPRLKQPMRLVDHLYFVAEHDDHHLTHIWELLR